MNRVHGTTIRKFFTFRVHILFLKIVTQLEELDIEKIKGFVCVYM